MWDELEMLAIVLGAWIGAALGFWLFTLLVAA